MWLPALFSSRRSRAGRRAACRPRLEPLEDRVVPTTRTWDGGGGSNLWTEFANWQGDVAPQANDDLVFPEVAARKNNVNNFAAGTDFNSIKFTGGGYTLDGNRVRLGAG